MTPSEVLAEADSPIAQAFRALKAVEAPINDLASVLGEVTAAIDNMPDTERASLQRVMLFLYLLVKHTRAADEQEALFEEIGRAARRQRTGWEDTVMTGAQVLINQGKREGRLEGREEEREESRQFLLELMRAKFGVLAGSTEEKVNSLTTAQLMEVARLLVNADTLDELGL